MGWLNTGASVMFAVIVTGSIVTHHPPREPTDAFRMLGAFPRVVAISSSNNDTSFKCLAATRTHFDLEAKKASYVWHLGGSHAATATRNVTFDIQAGNAPDQTTYFIDNDRTRPYTAYYNYTDYETCMVMIVPYNNHDHCLLWVKPAVTHAVPRHCLDNYEETCDVRVPQYDNDLCGHQE
uniref:Putative lipocalin 35 lipocalin n=1 Tax=Rhipicephalus microplus TaxID=6941 RepID=A0A6G5A4I4_RHIMP